MKPRIDREVHMRCCVPILLAIAASNLQAAINFAPVAVVAGDVPCVDSTREMGDLDRDGRTDFLLRCPTGPDQATVYLNRGANGFVAGAVLPGAAQLLDLDGDGALDAVWVESAVDGGQRDYSVVTARGLADGTFAATVSSGVVFSAAAASLHVVDLDADSDLDVLLVGSASLRGLRNDAGVLVPLAATTVPASFNVSAVQDLDGDGRVDLVDGLQPALQVGVGDGSFIARPFPVTQPDLGGAGFTSGLRFVTGIDIDGDGRRDLLMQRNESLEGEAARVRLRSYLRQADGSLMQTDELFVPTSRGPWTGDAHSLADLDGDGRTELAYTYNLRLCGGPTACVPQVNFAPNHLSYLVIEADGTLVQGPSYQLADVSFGDLDSDGRVDALSFPVGPGGSLGLHARLGDARPNQPPQATNTRLTLDVSIVPPYGEAWVYLLASDPDGQRLHATLLDGPRLAGAQLSCPPYLFCRYLPGPVAGRAHDLLVFEVDDGAGGSLRFTVDVTVTGPLANSGGGAPDLLGMALLGLFLLRRNQRRP
jgi:hypothetical protein